MIANLPYVPEKIDNKKLKTERKEAINFEPKNAIFAEDNGAKVIKDFLKQAKDRINKNGLILIELDPRNALELEIYTQEIFKEAKIKTFRDLARFSRYLKISL